MNGVEQRTQEVHGVEPGVLPECLPSPNPLIIKGLVAHWSAVEAGRRGDLAAYLRRLHRDSDVLVFRGSQKQGGRFFYNHDLSGFNFERVTARLGKVLDRMEAIGCGELNEHLYVGSSSVDEYFPQFQAENPLDMHPWSPLVSIWMGNQSRIAAHFDVPENLVCVVGGRRRFTLLPPEQLPNLYVGPLDFTPAGQAISMVDFHHPDFERYPRFREALAAAQLAELEPGDALYLPSMWWHHVESLDSINAMVNYWWTPVEGVFGNPMNAMMHALLSIRGMPERERDAWRDLFEHYVFGDGADLSHIPERRHGALGRLNEQAQQRLRDRLRRSL